ncbi:MAG TPA: MFS transporter [Rhizomicrobium sp.]|jgi:DHA2 family multidrug resistance protein-like MFS transporter|nr:MFS transporter [Rhizomicrobium sp.]
MTQTSDGQPVPQRYWAILTIALGIIMAVLDSAIANVALPTIARDLHTDAAFSIWVVNGYQLAITVSLLPLASLGDIIGYRRVYLCGMVLFTLASLACSLSHTLAQLALARVVQGFGAAGIMSVNTALIRFIYPQRLLGRGIGINAVVVAIAAAAGPTIASGILSVAHWPWLFAVNVPIGLVTLALGSKALPTTPRGSHGFDLAGAALSAATFGFLIGGIDAGGHGEAGRYVALELTLAVVFGYLLVRRELTRAVPLFPVDLLSIPMFGLSVGTSICSFAAQMLALVALPFHLQQEFGYTAVQTGLIITPWPLAIAVAAPIAGRLADRYPAGLLGALGLVVFAIGLVALAFLPQRPDFQEVAWRMVICGLGFGFFQAPNNRAMIAAAPRHRSGGASGMLGTARLLGQTMGAALVALLFGRIGEHATVYALFIAAGFAVTAAAVSSLRLFQTPAAPETRPLSSLASEENVMP